MQKDYLKFLISNCKKFSKQHDIFDIVLFGSYSRGKEDARDLDIILIFKEKSLRERSEVSQKLKESLKEEIINLDVKNINLNEFFESDFLATQAILVEGYSLIYDIPFSKRIGFEGYALFTYKLKRLSHNQKTKFTYALIGRNKEGISKKIGATPLGKGAVIIPINRSTMFEDFLKEWRVDYIKKNILMSLR